MTASDRPWSEERSERERAIVRLLRGSSYSREDAWLDGWQGEGLKRRGAIRIRRSRKVERYIDDQRKGLSDASSSTKRSEETTDNRGKSSDRSDLTSRNDEIDREAYTGRRTSIGSIERDSNTILFSLCEQLQDYENIDETMDNLKRLRGHLGSRAEKFR